MTVAASDPARATGPPHALGDAMSRVARLLQGEHADVDATLRAVTFSAVTTVPGADECGISYVLSRSTVEPRAWTSELTCQVDTLQGVLGQGPCLDAVWQHHVVRVDDVAADERWPEFGRRAAALGMGSMLCFQLFVDEDDLGALNLLARRPGAFTDESERVGLLFACHAAIAVADAQHLTHITTALGSRDIIGQAKGILMERYKITGDTAFALLAKTSQDTNSKLNEVAEYLTRTGTLGH